jgi:hypothetical protein
MAAKRKAARRRTTRRATKRTVTPGPELPARLQDFTKQIRTLLGKLEKEVTKAQTTYRRRAARLLREASVELGKFETRGESEWRKLSSTARRNALTILKRLEKFVGPAKSARRGAKARKVARRATRGAQRALREAASQVAPPSM